MLTTVFNLTVSKTILNRFVVVRLGTTKIFVGNIRDGTTSESLRELFECYGRVMEADVLSGFGFVVSKTAFFHANDGQLYRAG